MSDSPKRSTARIQAARQREIAAARRRQAEQERARRAEEAARRKRERLRRAQQDVGKRVQRSLGEVANVEESRFADRGDLRQLAQELGEIDQQLNSAADERAVSRLRKRLDKIHGRLKQVVSASRSAMERQDALRNEMRSAGDGPGTRRGRHETPFSDRIHDLLARLDRAATQAELSRVDLEWSKLRTEMRRFAAECDALDRSVKRVSGQFGDLQKRWGRFSGSEAVVFLSPESLDSIERQLRQLEQAIGAASDRSEVAEIERTLPKLAADASGAISTAESIYTKVQRVRKTADGLESRAASLSGKVVRRFVREDVLDDACSRLADVSAALNDRGAGSQLDALTANLTAIESSLSTLEDESEEARRFAVRVERELRSLASERQRFGESSSVQFAGQEISEVDADLRSVEVEFEEARTIEALESTLARLEGLDARLAEAVSNAEAAQLEHDIQQQHRVLEGLRETMSQVDRSSAEKFDLDGSKNATSSVERAASLLEARQLQKAVKEIVTASRVVNKHVQTVAERRAAYEAARQRAQEAMSATQRRADALLSNAPVRERLPNEIRSIENHLGQAESLFDREEFDKAVEAATTAAGEADVASELLSAWRRHDEVEADLASLDRSLCVQHDANGYQSTRQHLATTVNLLRQHEVSQADAELTSARRALQEHRQRVETHLVKWREERRKAEESLAIVRQSVDVARDDERIFPHVQDGLRAIENKMSRLQDRFEQNHFDAVQREAAGLSAELAGAMDAAQVLAQVVDEQARLVQAVGDASSSRFDAEGREEVGRLVSGIQDAVRRKQIADPDKELDSLRSRIDEHIAVVSEQLAEWNERRAEIGALIGEAEDRASAMASDETLMRWAGPDIDSLREHLGALSQMADDGAFERAKDGVTDWNEKAEAVLTAVEEVQLKEEQRNFILSGVQDVLRDMGFDVEDGFPCPEDSGNPFSATILRARQVNGRSISVSIPHEREEEVWYEVDGFDMNVDSQEGQLVRTCDEAQSQLEELHEQLHGLGIEMSELWWDGKPEGEWKAADSLPQSESQIRTQSQDE